MIKTHTLIGAALLALIAAPAAAADIYDFDQGHTEIRFGWSHAGVSMQHGEFDKMTGTLEIDGDAIGTAVANVVIDTTSISTGFEPLDTDLKSKNFLEVDTYPEMKFTSTSVVSTGDKTADVIGDLTLHGVTKPVTLKAELTHRGPHPLGKFLEYYHGEWMAFTAKTEIDHMAFGVGAYSTGPITIEITTEMKKR